MTSHHTTPPQRHLTTACLLAFLLAAAPLVSAQEKILDFSFDGSDFEETSGRGATGDLTLKFLATDRTPTDLHSAGGEGVSGKPGDKALDLTSALTMGGQDSTRAGPVAISPRTTCLDGLTSFTFQGWFKGDDQAIQGLARLISYRPSTGGEESGFGVYSSLSPGGLNFQGMGASESGGRFRSQSVFTQANEWYFFAITYAASTMTFYEGTTADPVTVRGTVPGITLEPIPPLGEISVGNMKFGMRPFKGWIDNIRVFGSQTDDSGALSLKQLDELREADVRGE
jgi:hypothetical protein